MASSTSLNSTAEQFSGKTIKVVSAKTTIERVLWNFKYLRIDTWAN